MHTFGSVGPQHVVLISEVGPRHLANCLAAHDVGVRSFDASLGGLGGCSVGRSSA